MQVIKAMPDGTLETFFKHPVMIGKVFDARYIGGVKNNEVIEYEDKFNKAQKEARVLLTKIKDASDEEKEALQLELKNIKVPKKPKIYESQKKQGKFRVIARKPGFNHVYLVESTKKKLTLMQEIALEVKNMFSEELNIEQEN